MQEKVELLINTSSRSGKQNQKRITELLSEYGFDITYVHQVNRQNPLPQALQKVTQRRPKLLVIGGGDGTISSVVDKMAGRQITIGIIPLGTTNNFARSLKIPLDVEQAIQVIRLKRARTIDLGVLNGDYFTNVAGIGLSADIARSVTNHHKRKYGRFAYLLVGIKLIVRHKPFYVTLQDPDHELGISMETRQLIIANGRYHAGKEISEDAKIDNGKLIIFALGGRTRLSLIKHTFDFYVGTRKNVAHASYLVGRGVEIRTSTIQHIEMDGEVKHQTPAIVSVREASVKVRVGT